MYTHMNDDDKTNHLSTGLGINILIVIMLGYRSQTYLLLYCYVDVICFKKRTL